MGPILKKHFNFVKKMYSNHQNTQSTPTLAAYFTMCDSTRQNGLVTRVMASMTAIPKITKANYTIQIEFMKNCY